MLPALIIGAVLLAGCVSAPQKVETQRWVCRTEVYELSTQDGMLFARSSGGIVCLRNGEVLTVREMPARATEPVVNGSGDGAFLAATAQYSGKRVATFWGGTKVFEVRENGLEPLFERPPAEGDYSMLSLGSVLFAGTNRGLFVWSGFWNRVDIGGELPFARVHGIARIGSDYVLGGIDGVFIGEPGDWKSISREPVRQVLQSGKDVWILYGSGAVDKLAADGRLLSDVLHGTAKRPWTASLAAISGGLLLGGHGGWVEKGSTYSEDYPSELAGQVVTAILKHGNTLFVGTQEKGLLRISPKGSHWINPGNGLGDTWVTAMCVSDGKVLAATATSGPYEIRGSYAVAVQSPSEKLRHLGIYEGNVVVGALDGAWIRNGSKWDLLKTEKQETTCIAVFDGKLWVGTPTGLFIVDR